MKVLYGQSIPEKSIAAIGVFDGVHRGHKKIFSIVRKSLQRKDTTAVAITFHPHPLKVIENRDVKLILPLRERIRRIESLGLSVFVLEFNLPFAKLTASDFLEQIKRLLNVESFVAGADFVFGSDRRRASEFSCFQIVDKLQIDGQQVSSSKIRAFLSRAELLSAKKFLGYWPRLWGVVVEGEGRAAKMGFPTANLELSSDLLLPEGVYIVKVYLNNKKAFWGLMSIGRKPTFYDNSKRLWVEIYINNFSGDLYNRKLEVAVYRFLRPQEKFDSQENLKEAIKKDVEVLKQFISR